ncbi:alkaline phosphatase family protein [bacterium]|nr:alkaline phosphatase family protein [bacterium]
MKFLKVFLNSLISGLFFSALLAVLIYDININTEFSLPFLGQITLFLMITYGSAIFIFSIIIFFIIQFISGKNIQLFYISPPFLSLSFSLIIFLFLLIFRSNYHYFHSFFSPFTENLIQFQFIALTILAFSGLIIFFTYLRKRKPGVMWVYFILFSLTMSLVIYQRTRYPSINLPEKVAHLQAKKIHKRVTLIGMKGLSFDFIIPLINEDKLPNFSWLMEEGSWGRLKSFPPTDEVILKSSLNTGKLPFNHRRISPFQYKLWNTHRKIEVVPRYIFFRQLLRAGILQIEPQQPPTYTKDIWKIFQDNHTPFLLKTNPEEKNWENPSPKSQTLFNLFYKDLNFETSDIFQKAKKAFYSDCEFELNVMEEKNQVQPQLLSFHLDGLNTVEAYFYQYSFPDLFGDIEQEELNKFSGVIERYYQFYDQIIGKHLASLKENELLVVYSPYGIEPLPLWKRFVEWMLGNAEISAYHEMAPEGVVFFYGTEVVRGEYVEKTKLIDIAPTILYYLGLHVGLDMDGIAKTSVFKEEFRAENPVPYISSYDEITIKSPQ